MKKLKCKTTIKNTCIISESQKLFIYWDYNMFSAPMYFSEVINQYTFQITREGATG